jgi:quercetin dioxygenase-like cupin family protein
MSEINEIVNGEGYAVGTLDLLGEGYGFRKVRKGLGVTAFGINAIVFPPGFGGPMHYHDEQEETYFVHSGTVQFEFEDGSSHEVGPGGVARVDAQTPRRVRNVGESDAVVLIAGGKDGYVGRDGQLVEGETGRVSPPPDAS